jgi:sulfite dehydrogenase (quinone) subunit SoeC
MIYASVRFLQEWASAFTLVNYTLLGLASGCTLATALAAFGAPALVPGFGGFALLFTLIGFVSRGLSLQRNARLKPKSTLQSAIGIRHPQITQRAMGFMGGSFNTREFFHGRTPGVLRQVKAGFLIGAFVAPLLLLAIGLAMGSATVLALAFVVQYLGLLAERWFFFAQANHPQNLYYQAVS